MSKNNNNKSIRMSVSFRFTPHLSSFFTLHSQLQPIQTQSLIAAINKLYMEDLCKESIAVIQPAITLLAKLKDQREIKKITLGTLLLVQINEARLHKTLSADNATPQSREMLEHITQVVLQFAPTYKKSLVPQYLNAIGDHFLKNPHEINTLDKLCFSKNFSNPILRSKIELILQGAEINLRSLTNPYKP